MDWLLINFIQDENKLNNIEKLHRNEGRDGFTTFDWHWKSMERYMYM